MANEPITDLVTTHGSRLPASTDLDDIIKAVATSRPELENLSQDQLYAIARAAVVDELKADFRRRVMAERVNWAAETDAFLSDCRSPKTADAYRRALLRLASWLQHKSLTHADLVPRLADDFIRDQRAGRGDADTHRLTISACSAFYTFLERRYDEVRNPFRGTRARPPATWPTATIPSTSEIELMIKESPGPLGAAIRIMAETGLRVGALIPLTIRQDGSFHTNTKGKRFESPDPMPARALDAIRKAGLDSRRPFADLPGTSPVVWLKVNLIRLAKRLHKQGLLQAPFSAHDLRHYYAECNKACGMHWLQSRLGHASLAITERYLRNTLGERVVVSGPASQMAAIDTGH